MSPSTAGTTSKPRAVSLTANPYFDTNAPDLDRQVQFATVNATVYFPKGGVYNGKYFKSCSATTVFQDETTLPEGLARGHRLRARTGHRPRRGRQGPVLQPEGRQGRDAPGDRLRAR